MLSLLGKRQHSPQRSWKENIELSIFRLKIRLPQRSYSDLISLVPKQNIETLEKMQTRARERGRVKVAGGINPIR